ncbi:thiamine biosynthesis protein ThiS [Fictibacillus macauensis ZFHKF-1]|uniref:Thiamine biosynthesis protein ThiS n=1 Tax=Fictibacillus macauensis ZFHKF-1 TaxID=1196324 RepID=I8UFS4_9BACL|nr:sulfur carrier protein ThiS [Fictibacillus macauensis]EIT85745.1 thiamine biosynthesis protein ThiS [Fictibacillus macauensis ZFHKF-1]
MKLFINGNHLDLEGAETVEDMLLELKLANKGAIVELNQEILDKSAHAQTRLSNGDKVEIVHFVGGG